MPISQVYVLSMLEREFFSWCGDCRFDVWKTQLHLGRFQCKRCIRRRVITGKVIHHKNDPVKTRVSRCLSLDALELQFVETKDGRRVLQSLEVLRVRLEEMKK